MAVAALLAMTTSCSSNDEGTQVVSLQVQVLLPQGFSGGGNAGQTVVLAKGAQTQTAVTNDQGVATFEGVIPDVYDISTSWEITPDEYEAATGLEVQNENYTLSGSLMKQTIAAPVSLTLQTSAAVNQSLLISKVYYAGSKDNNNKNYLAGKYIEFYNNSDKPVDVAGLYFGLVESNSTPAYMLNTTPDYLYLKQIFRFPADKSTMVQPGGTLLVCNSAIDHTAFAPNEKDLSKADFEAKDTKNTNNPNVPALTRISTVFPTLLSMNLVQSGPCGIVLFRTTEDPTTWEEVYSDGKSSGTQSIKMPIKYVMDGVEILKYATTGVDTSVKRLYDYIDAGYITNDATNGYNGKTVYRKIAKTTDDGRIVLQDTNNSSNDFALTDNIDLGKYVPND
jgi:hypothetical protein